MLDRLQDQKWIVYVLPGFLSLFVAGFVSDFPQIRDVLIPFVYVALTALSVIFPLAVTFVIAKISRRSIHLDELPSNGWFVTGVFLFSIVLGFVFGVAHSTDGVSNWLRQMLGKNVVLVSSHTEPVRLLLREAYQHDFVDEFDGVPAAYIPKKERNIYTVVNYGAGETAKIAHGVVHSYHSHTESPQAYLSPACTEESGKVTPIQGPGIWVNLTDVHSIEFVYQSCSSCAAAIKADTGNGELKSKCPFEGS
ncbi:hypothetical protein [Labrenzia sp. OB1]|uniref:hypothetical protein n=1 Tax=Labrenzia sp. OB1 TaxID=1561204 RepID=UPI0007B2F224|nr:hypothetical protein [Labrenzia sp. OB1]KZM50044.1 hypothetical protein OA90_11695 [Labrenzia sp. OB1]